MVSDGRVEVRALGLALFTCVRECAFSPPLVLVYVAIRVYSRALPSELLSATEFSWGARQFFAQLSSGDSR